MGTWSRASGSGAGTGVAHCTSTDGSGSPSRGGAGGNSAKPRRGLVVVPGEFVFVLQPQRQTARNTVPMTPVATEAAVAASTLAGP